MCILCVFVLSEPILRVLFRGSPKVRQGASVVAGFCWVWRDLRRGGNRFASAVHFTVIRQCKVQASFILGCERPNQAKNAVLKRSKCFVINEALSSCYSGLDSRFCRDGKAGLLCLVCTVCGFRLGRWAETSVVNALAIAGRDVLGILISCTRKIHFGIKRHTSVNRRADLQSRFD